MFNSKFDSITDLENHALAVRNGSNLIINENTLLIDMNNYVYADELYHIEDIHCHNCHERHDFYLKQGVSRCECCHEIVTATKRDFNSVAKRSPRAGGLRFKGIFNPQTRAKHFQFMKINGLELSHSN